MKRRMWIPLTVLAAIAALSLWNGHAVSDRAARWERELALVESAVRQEDWGAARSALTESYADWGAAQRWLQMVARHDAEDDAEALYRRCLLLCQEEDRTGAMEGLTELRSRIGALAGRERLTLGNVF